METNKPSNYLPIISSLIITGTLLAIASGVKDQKTKKIVVEAIKIPMAVIRIYDAITN